MRALLVAFFVVVVGGGYLASQRTPVEVAQPPGSVKPDALTCSGPPCVLAPTQASEGGNVVTDSPIVANPANHKELLLGSFDANCSPGAVGFHLSTDGGSKWQRVLCMPFIYTKQFVYVPLDEPSVGYDHRGKSYVAGLYFDNEGMGNGFVAVQSSRDGNQWSEPVLALGNRGKPSPFDASMAVDDNPSSRWLNNVYVSGIGPFHSENGKSQVFVSHSSDGGKEWVQVPVDPVQVFPEEDTFARIAVGRVGVLYASWGYCKGKRVQGGGLCPTVHVMFSKSGDGGSTWSQAKRIAVVGMPHYWQLPNTKYGERVYNYPMIAVDNGNAPYSGNIYIAMYTWTGTYLRVQVIRSSDGGKTWSQPVPLAPKSDTHDQFFPAVSVNSKGVVGVSWLDRRNDPANHDYQAFAAFSTDGGKTFSKNWQLTQAFSDPDADGESYRWMGDYTGNTWMNDNLFIAAWMDSSNGVDMQEVVGGVRLK